MPTYDASILLVLAMIACGTGIFLRLVAKEKYRREKWLQIRFEEQLRKNNKITTAGK